MTLEQRPQTVIHGRKKPRRAATGEHRVYQSLFLIENAHWILGREAFGVPPGPTPWVPPQTPPRKGAKRLGRCHQSARCTHDLDIRPQTESHVGAGDNPRTASATAMWPTSSRRALLSHRRASLGVGAHHLGQATVLRAHWFPVRNPAPGFRKSSPRFPSSFVVFP